MAYSEIFPNIWGASAFKGILWFSIDDWYIGVINLPGELLQVPLVKR